MYDKMENITKDALVDAIAEKTDITKKEVAMVIEAFTDTVTSALQARNKVTMTGFGTFSTSDRAAREGRNPATGETIQIAATTVAKFKVGKSLKEAVKK